MKILFRNKTTPMVLVSTDEFTEKHPVYGIKPSVKALKIPEQQINDQSPLKSSTTKVLTVNQKLLLANLSMGSFLEGCCIAVMMPFFPQEAASRGVSQLVGSASVYSSYAAAQLLASPLVARLTPLLRSGRLYNIGLAASGAATIAFGLLEFVPDSSFFVTCCLVTRCLEAAGAVVMQAAARRITANEFSGNTGLVYSLTESMTGVGLCVGPVIGGILYEQVGFCWPLLTLGAPMMLTASLGLCLPGTPARGPCSGTFDPIVSLQRVLLNTSDSWLCVASVFVVAVNWSATDPNSAPYLTQSTGIGPQTLGAFFFVSGVVYSLCSLIWGIFSERSNTGFGLMSFCLAMMSLGVFLIAPSSLLGHPPSLWLLGVGMCLRDVFMGGVYVSVLAEMMRASAKNGLQDDVDTRPFVTHVFSSAFLLGLVVGPSAGGYIADSLGYPGVSTTLALVSIVMSVILLFKAVSQRC